MGDWLDILPSFLVLWLCVAAALLALALALGFPYLAFYLLSLPLRRMERARFFLDLLETGLKSGRGAEPTLIEAALSRDRSLGVRFQLFAAHLESGRRFEQALALVPRLLPPQIVAMLKTGAQLGDLTKVLPACRQLLKDGYSQNRSAINYLMVMTLVITPVLPAVLLMLRTYVLPQMRAVMMDMTDGLTPAITELALNSSAWFAAIQIFFALVVLVLALCYLGGPRLRAWGYDFHYPVTDRLALWLPWRHKRLKRDFATLLAILLDSDVPEPVAVKLAAETTANRIFQARAERLVERLRQGGKLTEALTELDDTGEFQWRLANAMHSRQGFLAAIRGWLESLDAKAFQQEQMTAQTLTTSMVLVNGVLVALMAVGIFAFLVSLIERGVLW